MRQVAKMSPSRYQFGSNNVMFVLAVGIISTDYQQMYYVDY